MLPEEERFLPFHLSTDEAFRESLSRVESAIFLQQFAAGIYQLFGCPDTTTSAPSALYQEPISSFLVSSPHGFTLSCFHKEGKIHSMRIQATGPYTVGTAVFLASSTTCFFNFLEEHFV